MTELRKNDRVIGGMTATCSQRASDLYKLFVEGECVVTHARTAEMCKLTENSFRDVNIAFANELSLICTEQGSTSGNLSGWQTVIRASISCNPDLALAVTALPSIRGLSWHRILSWRGLSAPRVKLTIANRTGYWNRYSGRLPIA